MRTSYLFDHPSPCRNCGKVAKKHVETHRGVANEPYTGNMVVVRKEEHVSFGKECMNITLWDGETYIQKYGFFCTLDCASDYANRTVRTFEGKVAT